MFALKFDLEFGGKQVDSFDDIHPREFFMKQIVPMFLLAGLFLNSVSISAQADVLDNWTTNQITTNSFGLHHVVQGNNIFVAVGEESDSGGFYTSADGFHWTLQYSEPNSWGVTLNYSGGHFAGVCVGLGDGVADVSADGTNWTTTFFSYHGAPGYAPIAVTYGNGLYVIVGSTNYIASILTSPDGTTWTYRKASTSPGGPINSVAYGAGKFVAIGNNDGLEYTSSTGTGTWAKSSLPGGNKISYANGLFFVPLNNKTDLISVDGVNWSLQATGLTNQLGVVTYGNGLFMAQCGISQAGSYLATSTDGTNWFQYAKPLPNYCAIFDTSDFDVSVATDGIRLVAGGAILTNYYNYNGFIYASDPLVAIRMTNNPSPKVALSGLVGRNYQIQSADELNASLDAWRTNVVLQLPNTPYVWTDGTATNSKRFYRGVLLP
jgi:hypothetical protein